MKNQKDLEKCRELIDKLDKIIYEALDERFKVINEIKEIKKDMNITIENKDREQEIIDDLKAYLNDDTKYELYVPIIKEIIKQSKKYQNM